MAAEYMHIGIPVLNRKEGMTYNEAMKFWVSKVDDLEHYANQADRVIFGPLELGPGVRLAFVIWDDAIVELYEEK